MNLKKIREYYQQAVALHPTAHSDLKKALKTHERVPKFIDNLFFEIMKVQDQRVISGKKQYADKHIQDLVYDMTNLFITGLEHQYKEREKSELAKTAEKAKQDYQSDLDKSASGKMHGEFEELTKEAGVVFHEERN